MELLFAYFASVLATVTVEALKSGCSSGELDLARAIATTCAEFPQFDRLKSDLEEWTESDSFWEVFEVISDGQRKLEAETVVESFCQNSQHWAHPDHQGREATEAVVFAFLGAIRDELHRSDFGHSAMAHRQEVMHLETTGLLDQLQTSVREIEASLARSEARAAAAAVPGEGGGTTSSEDEEARARIDRARDLIQIGQIERAKSDLLALREGSALPTDLEFRLVTNLGACALAEGTEDLACLHFEQAHQIEPDNPKAISNAALAALLQDNFESAITLALDALELDPEDGHAAAVILEALWESGQRERLREFIASHRWVSGDRKSSLVLADIRRKQTRYEEAQQLYWSNLQEDPEDFGAHLMLSQCLLEEAQANLAVGGDEGELANARLEEADASASRAVELLEYTERKSNLSEALVVRAFIRGLREQHEQALDDLAAARRATPGKASVELVRGLVLMSAGRHEEARDAFLLVQNQDSSVDVTPPLAEAHFRNGDESAAASLVRGAFRFEHAGPDDLWKAELVCRAEVATGEPDPCWPPFEAAMEERPDDPWLLSVSAIRSRMVGDLERAEQMLQKAIGLTIDGHRAEIRFRLGSLYQEWGRFSDAADVYEEMAGGSGRHPLAIDLLVCLVNAKRLGEALSWARQIRGARDDVPKLVIDAEAQLLEAAGDLAAAASLRERICARSDCSAFDLVPLAIAQFRAGCRETAASIAESVVSRQLATDPPLLLRLAQLKRVLRLPGWLEDAYLARRFGNDDPEMHVAYFGMFAMQDPESSEPESIGPGSAMRLRNKQTEEHHWWLILDDGEDPLGPHEVSSKTDLAKRLIGKRVGDSIVLRRGIEDLEYEVLTLQSKYVRAFQETAEEFSTRFPDHPGLHRVVMEEGDYSKLLLMAERDNQHTQMAVAAYRDAPLPLPFATFATLLGRSVLEVWNACSGSDAVPVRFASGDEEEAKRGTASLSKACGIVLDLVALATVYKLDIVEPLRRRYTRIGVPQHVVDELQSAHTMALSAHLQGRIGKSDDGQYFATEPSEEQGSRWRDFTCGLLAFAESFNRVPSYAALDAGDTEPLIEMLTAAGVGTIYADEQFDGTPLVLVSDDLGLSTIALGMGKQVANSQQLLVELRQSGEITADEYSVAVEQLAMMRYSFVRVQPDDLARRYRLHDYQSSGGIRAMLGCLQGPECTQESAVSVAAQVVAELADEAPLHCLLLILDVMVAKIQRGRDPQQVLGQLAHSLQLSPKLLLLPVVREALLSSVNLHASLAPPALHISGP